MPPSSSSYKPASVLTMLLGPLGLLWYMALQQSLWITTHVEDGRRHGLLPPLQSPSTARDLPEIVWLASFPNSGTSYTMTMVEQASNRSVATNYGLEVTDYKYPSVPLHRHHPEGPYWEGNGDDHVLPDAFVLTKTHCGGRCVRCGAAEYVVNASTYLQACARTTARLGKNRRTVDNAMDPTRVARVVHLVRNPFTNAVARFHLESRNMRRREPRVGPWLPPNATGFGNFCQVLDEFFAADEERVLDDTMRRLMQAVPCRAEFYKWTQWHNRLGQILPSVGPPGGVQVPVLTLYYEDYHAHLNQTTTAVLDFLELEAILPVRSFRALPAYADHFTSGQREAAWHLIRALATPWTWERIQRYRDLEEDSPSAA